MFEKASSSQAPSASKRLFGSYLFDNCQSVFHLRTSFPRDLGNGMSFSGTSLSKMQCLIHYNRWHKTKQMAGVAIFVSKSVLHLDD